MFDDGDPMTSTHPIHTARRSLALACAVLFAVTACGSSATTAVPTVGPSATPSPAASTATGPSAGAVASPSASVTPLGTVRLALDWTAVEVQDVGRSVGKEPLLEVDGLTIDFWSNDRWNNVVNNTSFELARGEVLGLVGESGSGKTTLALAMIGYVRRGLRFAGGAVRLDGLDVLALPEDDLRKLRGSTLAYVPQDPATALNPARASGRNCAKRSRSTGATTPKRPTGCTSCWPRSVSGACRTRSTRSHTSSREGNSSARRSRWRSRAGPRSSCSTSRRPVST